MVRIIHRSINKKPITNTTVPVEVMLKGQQSLTKTKISLIALILLSILIALFFLVSGGCMAPGQKEVVLKNNLAVSTAEFTGTISWHENRSDTSSATLIGIHGTPGSWSAWQTLIGELDTQRLGFIAFDRPGWGDSRSEQDEVFPRFSTQAAVVAHALSHLSPQAPVILVAHSWGGPVALTLAAEYPDLVDGLVLIASPADPSVSRPRWYHRAAGNGLVQRVIGSALTRSNVEMLSLAQELDLLSEKLAEISNPVVVIQGKNDWLVAPGNAFYLRDMLVNANLKLNYHTDANHFIPFNRPDIVVEGIEWVLAQQESVAVGLPD